MDYLNTLVVTNTPIQKAIELIQKVPISHRLTDMYNRSSKNEVLFIGAATFLTLYNFSSYIKAQRQRLNLPPTVPYSLPLVGHTLYLSIMPNKFLGWCNEKYGELYNLDILGKTITVAGGKSAEEAMKAEQSDLSLEHGIVRDLLHLDYVFTPGIMDIGMRVNPAVAKFAIPNSKMPQYVPGIQAGLENAVHTLLNEKTNLIQHPSDFFQNFVAYMSVPSLVGDEFALNKEVIQSFAGFTGDVVKNVGVFMAVPKFLHRLILPYVQSTKKHQHVMIKHIGPIITQRREKMKLALEKGEPHGLEENFLQGLVEFVHKDEDGNIIHYNEEELAQAVLLVAFASVHTTSMNLSFSLYWLLARPDLMEKLLQEIETVCPGSEPVTHAELSQMKFLNNFMREVLRQGSDRITNGKKAMKDYTFANGYQVPKGRVVESSLRQMNFGNMIRDKVEEMDPDMSMNKISTTPAKDFVSFGMGKHLCPGRFFAVQEIQMSLVYLLKNFEIKTASGKTPQPVNFIIGNIATNCEEPLLFIAK